MEDGAKLRDREKVGEQAERAVADAVEVAGISDLGVAHAAPFGLANGRRGHGDVGRAENVRSGRMGVSGRWQRRERVDETAREVADTSRCAGPCPSVG